jgi:hypothetical protein
MFDISQEYAASIFMVKIRYLGEVTDNRKSCVRRDRSRRVSCQSQPRPGNRGFGLDGNQKPCIRQICSGQQTGQEQRTI